MIPTFMMISNQLNKDFLSLEQYKQCCVPFLVKQPLQHPRCPMNIGMLFNLSVEESSTGLTWSAWVQLIACGPPGIITSWLFSISFDSLAAVDWNGKMRSASPWIIRVGTSIRGKSLRKSVSQDGTQSRVPLAEALLHNSSGWHHYWCGQEHRRWRVSEKCRKIGWTVFDNRICHRRHFGQRLRDYLSSARRGGRSHQHCFLRSEPLPR